MYPRIRIVSAIVAIAVAVGMLFMGNMWISALWPLGFAMLPGNLGNIPSFPTAPAKATAGVGKEAPGVGDLEIIDTVMRHGTVASVDTLTALTYAKGVSVGTVKVPTGAGYISRIDIAAAGDFSNTATNGLYATTMVQLTGNGLVKAGWQRWAGPAMFSGGKTAGGGAMRHAVMTYATKIPVVGGNEMAIYGEAFGSDIGDVSLAAYLVFTKNGRDYGVEDSDLREADIATKDSETSLTTLGADTLGVITVPANFNHVPAFLIVAVPGLGADYISQTRVMVCGALGGNAMGRSGFYHYPSEGISVLCITDGLYGASVLPEIVNLGLPVQPGNQIELKATMIEEDPGLVSVMMGVLYGSLGGI